MAVPTLDSKLVPYSTNFNARIVASPGTFGLVAAQVTAYTALHNPYIAAAAAVEPRGNRSEVLIAARDAAKALLIPYARELYGIIQASRNVTDASKLLLGITIRAQPTTVGAPDTAPALEVGNRYANTVTAHLHETLGGSSRARPAGVAGASLFSYVGTTPPVNVEGWRFEGNTSRTTIDVVFPDDLAPGTTVYLTAFWFNRRGQSGPACSPVAAIIAGGGVARQAA